MKIENLYSIVWKTVHVIALIIGIICVALGLWSFTPVEHLADFHVNHAEMAEQMGFKESKPETESDKKEAAERKERFDNGTATEEDWEAWFEVFNDLVQEPKDDAPKLSIENDRAYASNDGGGTYTTNSMDREPAGRDS